MTKVLITGGAGFIGSHIAEYLQGRAHVRVLDNFRSGNPHNLEKLNVELIEGSITDPEIVARCVDGVDYVFHLAAMISVPESMENPQECVRINTLGLLNVLEASARAGVKKLCFSSSCAIYGDSPELPKTETMPPSPRSPYAMTKWEGEYYCSLFREQTRLKTVALRYFNVFGARQDPAGQYAAAIPIFIDRAVKGQPITIFGDGEQTRDFVFVKDVVAADIHFCMQSEASGTFNIGYGESVSVNQLAKKIIHIMQSPSQIRYVPERPGDVKHSRASVAKARTSGFTPSWTFDQGLEETLKSWRT